jgi:hypothetical protein
LYSVNTAKTKWPINVMPASLVSEFTKIKLTVYDTEISSFINIRVLGNPDLLWINMAENLFSLQRLMKVFHVDLIIHLNGISIDDISSLTDGLT